MNVRKAEVGEVLFQEGDTSNTLCIVADGIVKKTNAYAETTAEKGCLLGICGKTNISYPFTYTVLKPVTLYQYEYQQPEDLFALLSANQEACGLIACLTAQKFKEQIAVYETLLASCQVLFDTICEENEKYLQLCVHYQIEAKILPGIEQLGKYAEDCAIEEWISSYYASLGAFPPAKWKTFYENHVSASAGFILRANEDMQLLLTGCRKLSRYLDMIYDLYLSDFKIDLFTFILSLLEQAISKKMPLGPITDCMESLMQIIEQQTNLDSELVKTRFQEYRNLIPASEKKSNTPASKTMDASMIEKIKHSLANSFDTITDYAGFESTEKKQFLSLIKKYTALSDRSASDENTRNLRKALTAYFYDTYKKAFFKSLSDAALPTELKMFFYFGYIDETLAGVDNAVYLYYLAETLTPDEKAHVFTMYEWLIQIYQGKKEPCINELNIDYTSYLHKLKIEGRITEAEETADLKNGSKRVLYEFDNMFRSTNKMVFGHITAFCPLFSDHALYRPLDKMLLTPNEINKKLLQIKSIDYSLFYRETTFTAPEIGIPKEVIQIEVLPDIILIPGYGTRGAMWQEITGRKRTSPARFILPLFLSEDLDKTMLRMCGEFRWELCRRIQGVRWNDLGERSLTSDYCDYLQIYKRSRDISSEVKEKIKLSYSKYRNSSKEMFVHDYMDYIQFESTGSLRMNKLSRAILFNYCPFAAAIRESISMNQLYKELTDRYKIKRAHTVRLSDLSIQKIEKAGHSVPSLLKEYRHFLEL